MASVISLTPARYMCRNAVRLAVHGALRARGFATRTCFKSAWQSPLQRTQYRNWLPRVAFSLVRLYSTNAKDSMDAIRNVAIIAHVDHGKTSLVDRLLRYTGTIGNNADERVMDRNTLEKERGITIFSKAASVQYKGVRINIVDTPGHSDFGGEVERILSMVEGAVLLVDASEGPMPQTKYVLSKALKANLKPIVVLNKMDRDTARPDEVEEEILELFAPLDASDMQLDYVTLYASAREDWATRSRHDRSTRVNMVPLLDAILEQVPPPKVDLETPFRMLTTNIDYDNYMGRLLIGRIRSGTVAAGDPIHALAADGTVIESGKVFKVLHYRGLERAQIDRGVAGDIIALAGLSTATVNHTVAATSVTTPLPAAPIDPPVLSMIFSVNKSPFSGREGTKVTAAQLRDRLMRELENNVSITVTPVANNSEQFEVRGRGELQLGVLIENMRREGYELEVSKPQVVFRTDPTTGEKLEPVEEVFIEVDREFSGKVIESLALRKAELIDMKHSRDARSKLKFLCPSRGLIGYRSKFISETRGRGTINQVFHSWQPYKGKIEGVAKGSLVCIAAGKVTSYAVEGLEDRGIFYVAPGADTYSGQVIGEHCLSTDLDVNPVKTKRLTNIRAAGKEEFVRLTPPKILSLEEAMTTIKDDELVEITPKSVRMRKKELDQTARRKAARSEKD